MTPPVTNNDRPSGKWIAAAAVAATLVVLLALFFVSKWRSHTIVVGTIDYVVENLATRSGISPFLVRGIVILVTIPFFWAVAKYTHWMLWLHGVRPSLKLYRNPYGIIIVSYVGLFFIAMYFASRDAYAYKWCADTPEGIRTFDSAGIDPVYGIAAKPCTFDQIVALRQKERPFEGPRRIENIDVRQFTFFDPITGKPRVWYYKLADGTYAFYDKAGKYPGSGEDLLPIDQTTIQNAVRLQEGAQARARSLESERATEPYIDTSVTRGNQIAVLIFPKDQQEAAKGADQMVASALSEQSFTTTLTFFRPAFVSEGRARRLFSGDWSGIKDLEIGNRVRYVILGESNATFESSSQFEGLVTTNVSLDLKCLSPATHQGCGSRKITATGAGYSKDASLQNALEKAHPELVSFARLIPR